MVKRLFDLVLASFGLLVLSPLLLAIGLLIKFDSPGPALFRQERIGRHGRPFRIHKFRTMRHHPSAIGGAELTVGADPRITRVGAWLRRTKLDELPQLLDVLTGAMSLVGPRPEVRRYVVLYPDALRAKVLSVRPGITDMASLEYRDEGARLARAADPEREYVEVVMPAKLQAAARYVDEMSIATDLRVLGATLRALLRPR